MVLKMSYVKQNDPYIKTKMLLRAYDLTPTKLVRVLGCTYPTAKKRFDNPMYLTTGDWDKINKRGHVPIEEIRCAFLS